MCEDQDCLETIVRLRKEVDRLSTQVRYLMQDLRVARAASDVFYSESERLRWELEALKRSKEWPFEDGLHDPYK